MGEGVRHRVRYSEKLMAGSACGGPGLGSGGKSLGVDELDGPGVPRLAGGRRRGRSQNQVGVVEEVAPALVAPRGVPRRSAESTVLLLFGAHNPRTSLGLEP